MQQSIDVQFDIRRGVKNAHKLSPFIQAGFDQVNRMGNLVGHIPFADLFGQSFDELIPRILPHVSRCADYGLIDDPEKVVELLSRLQEYNGSDSYASLIEGLCDDDTALPQQAMTAIHLLNTQHGIAFPPIGRPTHLMREYRQRIEELTEHAGDMSYRSIWEEPMRKDLLTARAAIHRAIDSNLIFMIAWFVCCEGGSQCTPNPTHTWCVISGGWCTTGSMACGNHLSLADDSDCGCC